MPLDEPSLLEDYYDKQEIREAEKERYLQLVKDQTNDLLKLEVEILTEFLLTLCDEKTFSEYEHVEIQRWYRNKTAYFRSIAESKATLERESRTKKLEQYKSLKKELGIE